MRPNWKFTILYGCSLGTLIATEVVAALRARGGETLTQHWYWVGYGLQRWPTACYAWQASTSTLFLWLLAHFTGIRKGIKTNGQ